MLADKVAVSTKNGLGPVVTAILKVVKQSTTTNASMAKPEKLQTYSREFGPSVTFAILQLALYVFAFAWFFFWILDPLESIKNAIMSLVAFFMFLALLVQVFTFHSWDVRLELVRVVPVTANSTIRLVLLLIHQGTYT
jgi:hypothetical protein